MPKDVLRIMISNQPQNYVIAAFYHFFDFPDFEARQAELLETMKALNIKGSLLISREGFNSTLSGTRAAIDTYLAYLQSQIAGGPFSWKESYAATQPFGKARVRLKKETISLGELVSLEHRGHYVEPRDWNALISREDVVIIDTRNDYEVNLGTFQGAIDPKIADFKQLPDWSRRHLETYKGKAVATFCTGGIRCEKYTAWLNQEGFDEVYHLKGGILQYLADIPVEQSLWAGECFVFDQRIAVDHALMPSTSARLCLYCDHALTGEDQVHPAYVEGQSCPHCLGEKAFEHDRPPTNPAPIRQKRQGRTQF
jgi:UPF0176 protein